MDTKTQTTIRTKKLGVLIRDARLSARRNAQECAEAIGVRTGIFRAYEEGSKAPSLPELESLVYYLDLPLDQDKQSAGILAFHKEDLVAVKSCFRQSAAQIENGLHQSIFRAARRPLK
jgi:transcriptional regulator with XRE-family HTH domain